MKWEAFWELFQASVRGSYNETHKDFQGYLLMAIDSSHIALLRDVALREYYYGTTGHESSAVTAPSALYERENAIIVDASIDRLSMDERSLGKGHVEALRGMDFGKGSHW